MNDWSTDGRGNVRSSAVVGWRAEVITGDETGDVLLRIEFSVDPNLTDVSALQFRLTRQQADHIGGTLGSLADQSSSSAAPADCRKAFVSRQQTPDSGGNGKHMATRKEIADRVILAQRGMAIQGGTEFEILLKPWITGDVPIDGIRRRYITLLRERQRGRKVD